MIKSLLKYKDLLGLLIARDVKLKYRRSFLGYLWSVLSPLLSMIVMAVVFTAMLKRSMEHFPVYLLIGNIMFSFIRESSTLAMNSIIKNASLLKKTSVPTHIFTVATVSSTLVTFLLSLGALVIVVIADGVALSPNFLLILLPIAQMYIFAVGLGLFLAQGTVFFRDIRNIWSVVTLAWMYLTPIFYTLDMLSEGMRRLIPILNPMYTYITMARIMILDAAFPPWTMVAKGFLYALLMLLVGAGLFARNKKRFILYI